MEQFYLYGLIAITAACLKAVILFQSVTKTGINAAFNLVCIAMILQNTFEFLGYFTASESSFLSGLMVDGVMLSLYFVASSCVIFCCRVSEARFSGMISLAAWSTLTILVSVHLLGLVVTGHTITSYTIISIEGVLYPLFQIYVLAAVLISLSILWIGSKSTNIETKRRSKTVFIGIIPISLLAVSIVILRAAGFNSSTALVMPFATTLFVGVILMQERVDILTLKIKWRIIWSLVMNVRNLKLNEWLELVEKQLVMEALRSENNNKSAAARLLGANKTTFHRKVEKYCTYELVKTRTENSESEIGSDLDVEKIKNY